MSSAAFKADWEGTGSMEKFIEEMNRLFSAMNNIKFFLPSGYDGVEPTMNFKANSLEFDFGEALIFTLNNVVFNLEGTADYVSNTAEIINGQLVITIEANDIP